MTFHIFQCKACDEKFVSEKGKTTKCPKCQAEVLPPDATDNHCGFSDYTRKMLSLPFGKEAAKNFNSAKDVDACLAKIEKNYGHLGKGWGRV